MMIYAFFSLAGNYATSVRDILCISASMLISFLTKIKSNQMLVLCEVLLI